VEKLNEAAVGGDLNKMRELLNTPGVNIDAKYQGSETPLITACYEGHLPVAQLLIERGANINLKDSVGSLMFRSGVCLIFKNHCLPHLFSSA
jgi:ankyrin repeat protein